MLLIRGEKRCLAHTQILAAPRMEAVLSNSTFINVVMFLTPPRHAAGYGHRLGGWGVGVGGSQCVLWHTDVGVRAPSALVHVQCVKRAREEQRTERPDRRVRAQRSPW